MPEVGRNDPCPCGSGKKYKYCHWRIDQQTQRQNLQLERAWRTLSQRIWEFGSQEDLFMEVVSAWELFWDNRVPLSSMQKLGVLDRFRFIDWYSYDYRTSRNRKRIAERFLDQRATDLSSLEQDLARDWVKTHFSVYEVTGVTGDQADLQDIFTEQARTINQPDAEEHLIAGALLLARLLPLGGALRFAPAVTPIPAKDKNELTEFIRPRFKAWQEARYGASWKDFLSESGYLLNHFLIRDMEPIEPPATEQPEMPPRQAAQSIARRMQMQIITTNLNAHYERWLDKPIPEWGGKTPREMVETSEDAEKVEVLLELLEDIKEERAKTGQPTLNMDLLRRKLGLTIEKRTEGGIILPD